MSGSRTPRAVWLVARRELTDRLRSRPFRLVTLLLAVAVGAAILVPGLLRSDGPERYELALVAGSTADLAELLTSSADAAGVELDLRVVGEHGEAERLVSDGSVDAALVAGPQLLAPRPQLALDLRTVVDAAVNEDRVRTGLAELETDPEPVLGVLAELGPVPVGDVTGREGPGLEQLWVALGITVLLIVAVQFNGTILLNGAVEEKTSRVVEVLLGSLRPWQLLAGKLLATAALTLAQTAVIVAVALGANLLGGTLELPAAAPLVVVVALVMVLVGFVFYGALYLVAGAMVSSTEEAQTALAPLLVLLMGSYFAVIFAVLPDPTGTVALVLSLLPPSAPFTIPALLVFDALPAWRLVAGLTSTVVGAALAVRLAGRLYAAAVLAGGTLSWRELWRAEPIA